MRTGTITDTEQLELQVRPAAHLLGLCLKGGRQHVGEELERHRQKELHEGDDDEDQEGEESKDVGTRPQELC